ncbi:MAG TPA: UvrD-helicase domain-containing protein [bacterium]|nr:UvrD-helicase domain-containing protein [bacterium]HPN30824.1 UvrD-helicase domain-containing protein [bacterium]
MTPLFKWSDSILEVFEFQKNYCVQAGAGSGKTTALVELYFNLLKNNSSRTKSISPENILAITFTDKAANEMKERIFSRIESELSHSPGDFNFLKKSLESLRFASISTFHSFCANIIKEYSIETGITQNFSIINESEKKELINKFISDSYKTFISKKTESAEKIFFEFGSIPKISSELSELYETIRNRGIALSDILKKIETKLNDSNSQILNGNILESAGKINELLNGTIEAATIPKASITLKKVYSGLIEYGFTQKKDLKNISNLIELDKIIAGNWGAKFKYLRDGLKEEIKKLESALILPETYEYSMFIADVLLNAEKKMTDYKFQNNSFDFDDLIIQTVELLETNREARKRIRNKYEFILVDEFQDTNFMQEKLVKALGFSDDFPDNAKLFIVGDIKQSIYKFRGAEASIMKKWQNDFHKKFENCSIKFFPENRRTVKSLVGVINGLFENIMNNSTDDFGINYLPENVMNPVRPDIEENDVVCEFIKLKIPDSNNSEENPSSVESMENEIVGNESSEDDVGQTVYKTKEMRKFEAEFIAKKIIEMTSSPDKKIFVEDHTEKKIRVSKFKDIALLFRAFTDIKIYETKFKEYGIPYYVVKGRGFYDCFEIIDLISFLKIISNPLDMISFAAVLRSPFILLNDNQIALIFRQLNAGTGLKELKFDKNIFSSNSIKIIDEFIDFLIKVQSNYSKFRVFELLTLIIETFHYKLFLSTKFNYRQKLANIEKLLNISDNFDMNNSGILEDFIELLERLSEHSSNESEAELADEKADVVKLMTVHQSKGLEFPVVIIPDISRKSVYKSKRIIATENDLTMRINNLYGGKIKNSEYEDFQNADKSKEFEENKRIFYTACTRARDYLIFTAGEPAKKISGNWLEWVEPFFKKRREENSEYRIRYLEINPEITRENAIAKPVFSNITADPQIPPFSKYLEVKNYKTPVSDYIEISPTSLAIFYDCPRKFFYSHIIDAESYPAKETKPDDSEETPKKDCEEMNSNGSAGERFSDFITSGLYAHYLLEKIDILNPVDEIKKHIDRLSGRYAFKLDAEKINEANLSVIKAVKVLQSEIFSGKKFSIEKELPFYLKLTDSEFSAYLNGIIDLLAYNESEIFIIDYKYSRLKKNNPVNKTQLILYSFAIDEIFHRFPDNLYVFYLKEKNTGIDSFRLTDKEYFDAKKNILAAAQKLASISISNQNDINLFPCRFSAECENQNCGYYSLCKIQNRG